MNNKSEMCSKTLEPMQFFNGSFKGKNKEK